MVPDRDDFEQHEAGADGDEAAAVLHHPAAPEMAAFDDVVDLTDRRRILLQMVFGVDVEDPDPVFERDR